MPDVNLKKRVKLNGKWQFVAIPRAKDKFILTHILVNGQQVRSTTGMFHLDWRADGKRHQPSVGPDPREALEQYRNQSYALSHGEGSVLLPKPLKESRGTLIVDAIDSYLLDVKATKSLATLRDYRPSLNWFLKSTAKEYVQDLDRQDMMNLFTLGRELGLQQKTINKRVTTIINSMNRAGAKIELLKGDWPRLTKTQIETYRLEELSAFFAACDTKDRMLFQVFLCSGFRHMEAATLTWEDINWIEGSLSVTAKTDIGFHPKTYEERSVPIPRALVKALRAYSKTHHTRFVFPTEPHPTRMDIGGEGVDGKMLETCKEIAYRAGLNCGKCKVSKMGSCKQAASCSGWYLHKFRHTFATNMLRSGLDIKTVQILMGHQRITTTERYLQGLRLNELRDKVESSSLAGLLV